jgi:RNA polymerase sigma-70 factor, ECF subfamily
MDDADLVKAFRRGDEKAFSALVKKHAKPLTMMLLRIVRDPEEAQDLSQTAFLKAYEGLPRFMSASSFKTWLYKIALNAARDQLRRAKPVFVPEAADRLVDPVEPPGERLDKARYLERMRQAVDELPEKQRLTLQLRVYEELDYREIAKIVGGTASGARANFFQATRTLRQKLRSLK